MFFFILGFGSVFFGLGLGLVLVGESLELPDTRALLLAAVGEGFLNQDHVRDVFVIELLKVVVVEIGHGEVVSLGNRFFLKKKGGGSQAILEFTQRHCHQPAGRGQGGSGHGKWCRSCQNRSRVLLRHRPGRTATKTKTKNGVGVQVKQHEYKLPCREWGRAARHQGPRTR